MKKILFVLLICLCLIPSANAEEISINVKNHTFEEFYEKTVDYNGETIRLYDYFINIFNSQTEYKYYAIEFYSYSDQYFYNTHLRMFNDYSYTITSTSDMFKLTSDFYCITYGYHGDFYGPFNSNSGGGNVGFQIGNGSYTLLDTNVNFILNGGNYNITGLYDSTIKINSGDRIPSLKDLSNEEIRNAYINGEANYTTVNLDNYEYVILNLKDYSSKKAFETNMQVKGSVGITPVYEFGTIEKETITDVCNTSYSDFTDYRFFILKNDLINNAVYIVKNCQDSSSAFRYDSSVFDITYVTDENVNDPVVTFGGVEHHTIPFNKLSNTVNKNEEEGFIPGQSGSSLTDIVDNATNFTSDIWNSITSFMGLSTKFFNSLPEEFRTLSITAFTTLVIIAIIKFIRG